MRIVIVGCGRVGARLALDFDERGYEVSVIDGDSRSFRRLPENFRGHLVLGTGIAMRMGAVLLNFVPISYFLTRSHDF